MMQSNPLVIGQKYKAILNNCENIKEEIIWIPDNPYVDKRLAGHADLSIFSHRGMLYASNYLKNYINLKNCLFIEEFQEKKYPNDVKFNACSLGNSVILNEATVSYKILEKLRDEGSRVIPVKQGYTKCSTLVLNDKTIITSDAGIETAAKSNGIYVLKISEGNIALSGFPYGFIGGCGFMYDTKTLILTGKIDDHPDKDRILSFCKNLSITIDYLTCNSIFDIGGIIKAG